MMYFQTNDETKVISIAPGDDVADVVDANSVQHGDFNLANTCKASTMQKVRDAAKAAGLKLHQPTTMAVR